MTVGLYGPLTFIPIVNSHGLFREVCFRSIGLYFSTEQDKANLIRYNDVTPGDITALPGPGLQSSETTGVKPERRSGCTRSAPAASVYFYLKTFTQEDVYC